jgi:hypothetical protein
MQHREPLQIVRRPDTCLPQRMHSDARDRQCNRPDQWSPDVRGEMFGLGQSPTIGIAEARRKARSLAEEVRAGADPVRLARARRNDAKAHQRGETLGTLLALYSRQQGASVRSWATQMGPIGRLWSFGTGV